VNVRAFASLACLALAFTSSAARAQPFAEPPADQPVLADGSQVPPDRNPTFAEPEPPFFAPRSTLRLGVGPALRISQHDPDGGLFAAVDIGERAAGLRLSGSWVRVGEQHGMQEYTGELWIDFGEGERLHPILGAGAGVARVDRLDPQSGDRTASTLGVGVLRGTLQYALPVRGTDARAGLELIGSIPAIRGSNEPELNPWLLLVATVGVGF
jgi:hypothetical protein